MFRTLSAIISLSFLLTTCSPKNDAPDVSDIKVGLEIIRFEKAFFEMDTTDIRRSFNTLSQKHPGFTSLFAEQILGIPPNDSGDLTVTVLKTFLNDYRPILKMSDAVFLDFKKQEEEIRQGLRYLRHYFPEYEQPKRLYTFIGPLDAFAEGMTGGYGDIITADGLAVGLQLHLGSESPLYTSREGQLMYPMYISRRFTPEYVSVNCMKNIIDDLYPGLDNYRTFLDHMVDRGKRMYLLDKLLPFTADTLKFGYTSSQLKGAEDNEGLIWKHLTENNVIYETDPLKFKTYMSDGPKTMELGDGSPGFISLFVGRQLISTYMNRNPKTTLQALLNMDARSILSGSKYKPR